MKFVGLLYHNRENGMARMFFQFAPDVTQGYAEKKLADFRAAWPELHFSILYELV